MSSTNPILACSSTKLRPGEQDKAETEERIREPAGGLMWLASITRPDILGAVRDVAGHPYC